MRSPSHSTPAYVAARIRKALTAKGWPLHKMTGRYSPFFNSQTGTEGYAVRRIGCSKTLAISYSAAYSEGQSSDVPDRKERERAAIEYLRELGYRIDDRGWIECEHYGD